MPQDRCDADSAVLTIQPAKQHKTTQKTDFRKAFADVNVHTDVPVGWMTSLSQLGADVKYLKHLVEVNLNLDGCTIAVKSCDL